MKRPDMKTSKGEISLKVNEKLQKNLIEDKKLIAKNLKAFKRSDKEDFFS